MSGNKGKSSGAVSNTELGLGSHSISHSFPVPNKPYGFHGRKAPTKRKKERKKEKGPDVTPFAVDRIFNPNY